MEFDKHFLGKLLPSVIFEAKDGKWGEDGSETLDDFKAKEAEDKKQTPSASATSAGFSNSFDDLKTAIGNLIVMERQSGSMDVITPLYVSRMLNVPLEEVERVMNGEQGMFAVE